MRSLLAVIAVLFSTHVFSAEVRVLSNVVEFNVNRDVQVHNASIGIRCLREATFFERFNNGMKDYMTCDDFTVDGKAPGYSSPSIKLMKIGKNKFELSRDVFVKYSTSRKGHVCLIIKANFEGSVQHEVSNDSYSLLSFCSVKSLPFSINDYVYNNRRVPSLNQFNDAVGRPIQINLK